MLRLPSALMRIVIGAVTLFSGLSIADPILGRFDIGGSSATVTAADLTFNCNPALVVAPCVAAPGGYGNFIIPSATSGFSGIVGTGGYIGSLSNASQPIGMAFPVPLSDWITLVAAPGYSFDLNFIFAGTHPQDECAEAANPAQLPAQVCTPIIPGLANPGNPLGLSPFNLSNTPNGGSTATFSLSGWEREIATGLTAPFNGIFTAQFDVPYQTLLAELADPGDGEINTNSYSATISVVIPEPGTWSGMIGGVLVFGSIALRRRFKKT